MSLLRFIERGPPEYGAICLTRRKLKSNSRELCRQLVATELFSSSTPLDCSEVSTGHIGLAFSFFQCFSPLHAFLLLRYNKMSERTNVETRVKKRKYSDESRVIRRDVDILRLSSS